MTTAAHSNLLSMEDDILAVRRWASVLIHLGQSASACQPGEIHVIAHAMASLGQRLERDWKAAHEAMGGDR